MSCLVLAPLVLLCLLGSQTFGDSAESKYSTNVFVGGPSKNSIYPSYPQKAEDDKRPFGYKGNYESREFFATGFGKSVYSQDEFVAAINNRTRSWIAGKNALPSKFYRPSMILGESYKFQLPKGFSLAKDYTTLPDTFDARQKWPQCTSMMTVRDQGCCGSGYAVAAVSTMSDRWCIHSNGQEQFSFGAYDVMACCQQCGFGCEGGHPAAVWQYWVDNGIISGGAYNSNEGCQSYPFGACQQHPEEASVLPCLRTCQTGYNVTYYADKHYGSVAYTVPADEERIKFEIVNSGPVEATFTLYSDFPQYKSGVYHHTFGVRLGSHSIKLLGWGVESNEKYWLVANSWGTTWGQNGYAKFIRGENHVGIESEVMAGLPKLGRS